MRWFTFSSLVFGCGGPTTADDGPEPTDDSLTRDTADYPWPVWLYDASVAPGTSEWAAADGAAALRVDGFTWGRWFGGPTLVAELDHEVRFTVKNDTEQDLPFEWPGVEVLEALPIPAGATGLASFRTTLGPGVHVDRPLSEGDVLARRGLFGLISVRDPLVFPVEDLDEQANLIIIDPPPEYSEVDGCRFDPPSTHAACPAWRPASAGETTALLTQRLIFNLSPLRHGSAPNEFLTATVGSLQAAVGDDLRINLASLADGRHTLSLGGLSAVDPLGAAVTQVSIEPGQTTWLLLEAVGPVGAYELGCIDHDHHGLGRVMLTVSE